MPEIDVFAYIVENYGALRRVQSVSQETAERYRRRLPEAMIKFWLKYGWGDYKNGYFWICDPAPFDPLLERIFKGDPEFHAEELTLVAYTAFNHLEVWDGKNGRTILIDMEQSNVSAQSLSATVNRETGQPFSKDFLIGTMLNVVMVDDTEYFEMACEKLGRPVAGDCFGYVPALQLGGSKDLDHLHRMNILEHTSFLAQLGPLKLVELTAPRPPDFPFGDLEPVRLIGPQK